MPITSTAFTYTDHCVLTLEVGTNHQPGDDTRRWATELRLRNDGGANLRVGKNGSSQEEVESVQIVMYGKAECDALVTLLESGLRVLKEQRINIIEACKKVDLDT